jgi:hypothetical protein
MPDTLSTNPLPSASGRSSSRAEQDQKIANDITEIGERIGSATRDPEVAALLAERGYDPDAFAAGQALQETAQAAFTARQTALGAQHQASAALDGARMTALQTYNDFRETARAVFTSTADRSTLSLNGRVPKDAQAFITLARASYTGAQSVPYQATLAKYGYPAAALATALATLNAYSAAHQASTSAAADATQAIVLRDAAYKNLVQWDKQFRAIAKVAARTRSDLARKLNL